MARKRRNATPSTADFIPLAGAVEALADPSRVHILALLGDRTERSVTAIVEELNAANDGLGLSQPTVSHHLRVLRVAGLVTREQCGRSVHYSIDVDAVLELANHVIALAKVPSPSPAA